DQQLDFEPQVGDCREIPLQHLSIARKSERATVVGDLVGDELSKLFPVLAVQAGDVVAIDVGEVRLGHGCLLRFGRSLTRGASPPPDPACRWAGGKSQSRCQITPWPARLTGSGAARRHAEWSHACERHSMGDTLG